MSLKASIVCLSLACVALGWLLCLVTMWFRDKFMNDEEDEFEEEKV